jgi:hypothetical protein
MLLIARYALHSNHWFRVAEGDLSMASRWHDISIPFYDPPARFARLVFPTTLNKAENRMSIGVIQLDSVTKL